MTTLTLINITKTYHKNSSLPVHAIQNIYLELLQGETVSVHGESGAGKSTLLQIMGCTDAPSAGQYYLGSHRICFENRNELNRVRNTKVGIVLPPDELMQQETVSENIILPLLLCAHPLSSAYRRAFDAARIAGVSHVFERRVTSLKPADKVRVAIARAVVNDPEVILADEPTTGLDTDSAMMIMDLLQDISKNRKKSVLIATKDMTAARRCDRSLKISNGNICYSKLEKKEIEIRQPPGRIAVNE